MARRQNFSYERFQRQAAKTAKREAKRETRANAKASGPGDSTEGVAGQLEPAETPAGGADAEVPAQEV